jgi:two-component sensor histidine kinase
VQTGRLNVRWDALDVGGPAPLLVLEWRETAGPSVAPQRSSGFGSRLVKASAEQDLAGAVSLDYAATGLVCRIEAPLPKVTEPVELDLEPN